MQEGNSAHRDMLSLEKKVESVSDKVDEIHNALMGSAMSKDGGIIRRLIECEEDLDEIEKMIKILERRNTKNHLYLNIIWGGVGAFLMGVLIAVANHFLFKS